MRVLCPQCRAEIPVALDNPPAELECSSCRRRFLRATGDTAISLRDANKDTVTYIPEPSFPNASSARDPALDRDTALNTFGDYDILTEIARGGMGVVYKARQKSLGRIVALKMIKVGELAGEAEISRFRNEAEAVAKLDHPHIVPIYEVGEQAGRHYFSMGFVEGQSLSQRIQAGPLPPIDAAALTKSIAEAVAYAHQQGIIHRDLKPSNILLATDANPLIVQPSTLNAKIIDFGLAKQLASDSSLTATGQVMGTPSYMPPEQAAGRTNEVDARSDVYSLGAILYHCLTGRPPFQAANAVETLKQVLEQDPVSPRLLNPAVDRDLETICLKCLEKEPNRRFHTAADMAEELSRWQEGKPIIARPASRLEKIWKWCKRRPSLVGVSFIAMLVLLVVSLFLIESKNKAEATRLVEGLLQAETSQVGAIIDDLREFQSWAWDDLAVAYEQSPAESNAKLHAALALMPEDASVLPFLQERLLSVSPNQFEYVRNLLATHATELTPEYWKIANNPGEYPSRRFQAACAVAHFDPRNDLWQDREFGRFVVGHLVGVFPSDLRPWQDALRQVKDQLREPLTEIYRDNTLPVQHRSFATDTLAEFLNDDPDHLFHLLADADEVQFPRMFDKLAAHQARAIELGNKEIDRNSDQNANLAGKETLAIRKANAAVMLLRMGAPDRVWPLLKHSHDPRTRSYIIHWLNSRGVPPQTIIDHYEREPDVTVKRALLLCLGEFDETRLQLKDRSPLIEKLFSDYRDDPDAGLHSAAEWLLRQWGQSKLVATIDRESMDAARHDAKHQWYINGQGQTFAILDAGEFQMGSPTDELGGAAIEPLQRVRIDKCAISMKEVTVGEWRQFLNSVNGELDSVVNKLLGDHARSEDSPMVLVSWFEIARYCNWLSEREGISREQWCYDENNRPKSDMLALSGYRLPTELEWEYACRAGSRTAHFFGQTSEFLPKFAWYDANSSGHTHPVASLKPNDFGLFDILGNSQEWCLDEFGDYPSTGGISNDATRLSCVVRGGGYFSKAMRSADRSVSGAETRDTRIGFRLARSIGMTVTPEFATAENSVEFHIQGFGEEFEVSDVDGNVTVVPAKGTAPATVRVIPKFPTSSEFSFWISEEGGIRKYPVSGVVLAEGGDAGYDLLPIIDPERDSVRGLWRRESKSIVCDPSPDAVLQVPCMPCASYDLVISAERLQGIDAFTLMVHSESYRAFVGLDMRGDSIGFHLSDNAFAFANETTRRFPIFRQGAEREMVVQVRPNRLSLYLDDALLIESRKVQDLRCPEYLDVRDKMFFGIGTHNSKYQIHELRLRRPRFAVRPEFALGHQSVDLDVEGGGQNVEIVAVDGDVQAKLLNDGLKLRVTSNSEGTQPYTVSVKDPQSGVVFEAKGLILGRMATENLLNHVVAERDSIQGVWNVENGTICMASTEQVHAILEIPYTLPENYTVTFKARRLPETTSSLALIFPLGSRQAFLGLDMLGNVAGLQLEVNEPAFRNRTSFSKSLLGDGREHTIMIQVRPDLVELWRDGEQWVKFDDVSDATVPSNQPTKNSQFVNFSVREKDIQIRDLSIFGEFGERN